MEVLDMDQGSEEWHLKRMGVATASCFSKIVKPSTGEKSTQAKAYMYGLIAQRLGASLEETFSNEWTERGNEVEAMARGTFEFITDLEVEEVGMILNADGTIGCSPDGLVGKDGGLEIKCPKASTHIKYLLENRVPIEYKTQVQGSMMVTGRKFWYFMSYHPELDPLILKVERDEEFIGKMQKAIDEFVVEMLSKVEALNGNKPTVQ